MATISKTGIQDGLASKAEHLTRIIDALDGTATTEVVATGSFTGSFVGDGSALTGVGGSGIFAQTGSIYATTNDLEITGSAVITGNTTINGNFATNARVNFSGSTEVRVPWQILDNSAGAVDTTFSNLPAGGHILANISGDESFEITLPTAEASVLGYEWSITIYAKGGNGDLVIDGGASRIHGTISAVSNAKSFSAASTVTVDAGTCVIGDCLIIRSMGSAGWLITGTFANGNSIT